MLAPCFLVFAALFAAPTYIVPFLESVTGISATGIAFGSIAGGVALDHSTASSAVVTGLSIVAAAIPVAWATSHLNPPVDEEHAEPAAELSPVHV